MNFHLFHLGGGGGFNVSIERMGTDKDCLVCIDLVCNLTVDKISKYFQSLCPQFPIMEHIQFVPPMRVSISRSVQSSVIISL